MADMNSIKTRRGRGSSGGGVVSGPKVNDPFTQHDCGTPSFAPKPGAKIGSDGGRGKGTKSH